MLKYILRGFAKFIGIIALLLVLAVGGIIIINQFDEKLNPDFETYFAESTPIPDAENGYYALQGLDAPKDADILAFGKASARTVNSQPPEQPLISFKGENNHLACWIAQKQRADMTPCPSEEELQQMISDNQLLLERFASLYHYRHFEKSGEFMTSLKGQLSIELQQLMMAQLVLQARNGKVEEALQSWLDNMHFTQRLIAGKHGVTDQAIAMSVRGISIEAYPMIAAHATPKQLTKHKQALDEVFSAPSFGKGGWDTKQTMHAEYDLLNDLNGRADFDRPSNKSSDNPIGFYLSNATRNFFYDYAKDFVALSNNQASEIIEHHQKFASKYKYKKTTMLEMPNRLYNTIGKLILHAMSNGADLLIATHYQTAKLHLLKLYTEAKIAGIKPEDMAAFVAKTPADMQNPFTNKPFEWNAEKHSIIFTRHDNIQAFEIIY